MYMPLKDEFFGPVMPSLLVVLKVPIPPTNFREQCEILGVERNLVTVPAKMLANACIVVVEERNSQFALEWSLNLKTKVLSLD